MLSKILLTIGWAIVHLSISTLWNVSKPDFYAAFSDLDKADSSLVALFVTAVQVGLFAPYYFIWRNYFYKTSNSSESECSDRSIEHFEHESKSEAELSIDLSKKLVPELGYEGYNEIPSTPSYLESAELHEIEEWDIKRRSRNWGILLGVIAAPGSFIAMLARGMNLDVAITMSVLFAPLISYCTYVLVAFFKRTRSLYL